MEIISEVVLHYRHWEPGLIPLCRFILRTEPVMLVEGRRFGTDSSDLDGMCVRAMAVCHSLMERLHCPC